MSLAPPIEPPAPRPAAVRRTVELAGWRCVVEAALPDAAERLAEIFGAYGEAGFEAASGTADAEIAVRPDAAGFPRFRLTGRGRAYCSSELTAGPDWKRFVPVPHPSRRLFAELRAGEAPVLEELPGELLLLRPELWPRYVQLGLLWLLLRERPVVGLHAAVSAVAGHALVLVGNSGTGKSTLSWALGRRGADYFGDECAFFTLPDHHLHVLMRELRLRPGGLAALGSPLDAPAWFEVRPNDPKCAAPLPPPARPCPRDRVSFFFMDGFAPAAALRPIRGRDAVQRLMAGMVYREPSVMERLEVAAALADRYPCWSLAAGPPAETAALLAAYARGER
jgi:hypothetical protein